MKVYLEVIKFESKEVVKRVDVSGWSNSKIERLENGINRNLNHADYYTFTTQYSNPQPII